MTLLDGGQVSTLYRHSGRADRTGIAISRSTCLRTLKRDTKHVRLWCWRWFMRVW